MAHPWDELPTITSVEELETFGQPAPAVRDKVLDRLEPIHCEFIAASPLVLIATATPDGRCDVSPKGDPHGFVTVLDPGTLVIPERPGNNRFDGFHNIITNPYAGLIFVIPGRGDSLRVNGEVRLVSDGPFFDDMAVKGHRPRLALMMKIEEVFFHCPKAFMRSKTWQPETWNPEAVMSYAELAQQFWRAGDDPAHVAHDYDAENYSKGLYRPE